MKTLKYILLVSTSLIIFASCQKGSVWGIYGKGTSVTRERTVTAYSGINLNCDANIIFVKDSVYSMKVTAQENIQSILETKVVDSELRVSFLREVRTHDGVIITIHAPSLNSLLINGSGNISAEGTCTAGAISLYVNGSGNITLPTLNSNSIDAKIAGSGNININAGTNTTAVYYVNGSGNVNALGMTSKSCTVKITGSGNVTVNATDNLNVTLTGSGDLKYKGNPTVSSQVTGSGRLIHL